MKKRIKPIYFREKFNQHLLIIAIVAFVASSLLLFFAINLIAKSTVKDKALKEFAGVNHKLMKPNSPSFTPITEGILRANEMVVVYVGEDIKYASPIPKDNDKLKEITLLVSKNENEKRAIRVKLYLDMGARVRGYYLNMYLVIFPVLFFTIGIVAFLLVRFVRKDTERLYGVLQDLKEFETLGLAFNQVKRFDGQDEAAVISREYNKILKALRDSYDKERQFVYDAAHELRVPLVKIEGSVNLLDKKGFTEESRNIEKEHMKTCLHEAKSLVDNMFDLTHEVIVVKDRINGTNLGEVINDVVESYKLIYEDFTFQIDSSELFWQIRKADMVKLLNIFMDNAIKYSKDDKKQIDIKLVQNKDKYVLSIKDYGIGMTPEQQQRMFETFWRADPSRQRETGGVGIGLSIAKKLCESYDLKVSVSSIVDKGTTIELEFV